MKAELARAVQHTQTATSRWEHKDPRERTVPAPDRCDKIARLFDLPPNEVRRRAGRELLLEQDAPAAESIRLPSKVAVVVRQAIARIQDQPECVQLLAARIWLDSADRITAAGLFASEGSDRP